MKRNLRPSPAPLSVTARKNKTTNTRYGNVAVKYTTYRENERKNEGGGKRQGGRDKEKGREKMKDGRDKVIISNNCSIILYNMKLV